MKLHEIKTFFILESLTTRADITWQQDPGRKKIDRGYFDINGERYQINVEHNILSLPQRELNTIDVSFSRIAYTGPIVKKTDSKHPNRVFGAVMNGIIDKIKEIRPQIVLFSAKFGTDLDKQGKPDLKIFNKRVSLYKLLQYYIARISGYNELEETLIGKTGHHFILIHQHVNITKEELEYIKSSIMVP